MFHGIREWYINCNMWLILCDQSNKLEVPEKICMEIKKEWNRQIIMTFMWTSWKFWSFVFAKKPGSHIGKTTRGPNETCPNKLTRKNTDCGIWILNHAIDHEGVLLTEHRWWQKAKSQNKFILSVWIWIDQPANF